MTDIVDRLRTDGEHKWEFLVDAAADEIESLRELLDQALGSRAPDYVEVAYPGWTERAKAAIARS